MVLGVSGETSASETGAARSEVPLSGTLNVLCVCGAIVGLAAVFCSWLVVTEGNAGESTSLATILDEGASLWRDWEGYFGLSLLFVIGTVLAFVSPLSGLLQALGLGVIAWRVLDARSSLADGGYEGEFGVGLGFYLGALSAGLVVISLIVPQGPGFETGVHGLRNRLLVLARMKTSVVYYKRWSLARDPPRRLRERLSDGRSRLYSRLSKKPGKWTAFVVATCVWSFTVVSLGGDFPEDGRLVTPIEDGIAVDSYSFGLSPTFPYYAYHLSLEDGENATGWRFSDYRLDDSGIESYPLELSSEAQELDDGSWCAVDLGSKHLGDVEVSLTVIEQMGDGILSGCDSLVVTAENGTHFEEDRVYSIWWRTNRALSWTGTEISFVIHDGEIDSCVSTDWFLGL